MFNNYRAPTIVRSWIPKMVRGLYWRGCADLLREVHVTHSNTFTESSLWSSPPTERRKTVNLYDFTLETFQEVPCGL